MEQAPRSLCLHLLSEDETAFLSLSWTLFLVPVEDGDFPGFGRLPLEMAAPLKPQCGPSITSSGHWKV